MDNSTFTAIKEAVEKHSDIGVITGKNPNLDTMAATLSLYLALKKLSKNVSVASPTEPIVEIASLVGIHKVKTNLATEDGDLIVSFPYREGEIEKVSYTLEDGYLNIVVKAGELGLTFDEKDVKYKRQGNLPSLLFVVGTPRLADLGNLFDPEALKDTTIINIDNRQDNQGFGDITYVSSQFSSVSEMVADLLFSLDSGVDIDIAQNLLSGIHFGTDNFQEPKTSYMAFDMAARLMRIGAVRTKPFERQTQDTSFYKPRSPMQQQYTQPMHQPDTRAQMPSPRQSFGGQPQQRQFPKRQQQQPQQQSPATKQGTSQSQQFQATQPRSAGQSQTNQQDQRDDAPADWLTPKVYRGSTNIE